LSIKRLALLAAAITVFSACGDDGATSKSPAATASGSATAPVGSTSASTGTSGAGAPTGTPYRIGIPYVGSGPGAVAYTGLPPAVDAWQKWVNNNGGINGHPVEVLVKDSTGDPAKGSSIVRDMVENKKVVALHLEDPSLDNAILSYTQGKKIAVISSYAAYPIWNTSINWFALGIQSSPDSHRAYLQAAATSGKKSIGAILCAEYAACGEVDASLKQYAPAAGVRYDGSQKVAVVAPNYTAECLAFKAKGTETIFAGVSIDVTKKFLSDCATQRYKPSVIMGYHSFNPAVADLKDTEVTAIMPVLPWYADVPAMKDFRAAMTKYSDLKKADLTSLYAWTSLEAFRTAAIQANLPENPTLDQVTSAMAALKTNLNGLLAATVSFTAGKPSPKVPCYFLGLYKNGEFSLPKGDTPECLAPS
jgi:branched-chain amino acid transport system substrate-binding protein